MARVKPRKRNTAASHHWGPETPKSNDKKLAAKNNVGTSIYAKQYRRIKTAGRHACASTRANLSTSTKNTINAGTRGGTGGWEPFTQHAQRTRTKLIHNVTSVPTNSLALGEDGLLSIEGTIKDTQPQKAALIARNTTHCCLTLKHANHKSTQSSSQGKTKNGPDSVEGGWQQRRRRTSTHRKTQEALRLVTLRVSEKKHFSFFIFEPRKRGR